MLVASLLEGSRWMLPRGLREGRKEGTKQGTVWWCEQTGKGKLSVASESTEGSILVRSVATTGSEGSGSQTQCLQPESI